MLKDDFESFFERQAWFRENKLPFRRGYLLHGPPGNGKFSAIRAMMTSRGLTAYTMTLFTDQQDDNDLNNLFELAVKNRPSMVLLENLDRAFPKTGETKSRISLQALLNCLDGVGSGEGIVVVATANEPTILDPAILRRPGRFDRVVRFSNPCAALRQQYLQQLNPGLPARHLKLSVEQSDGLSFAQLREVHVIAGQRAFERKGEIGEGEIGAAIQKSQIWCAVATYVLIAIVKKELKLDASLYTCLQILSVSIFEKTAISCALQPCLHRTDQPTFSNQLNLFDI
jgi:ATP-dependent 26S proteasome regulatory subunit